MIIEFQKMPKNIWLEVIEFCMSKPEGTSVGALQYMLAKELGYEADETTVALANIRF